jgi:ABC-2 type transport system ATP-binding protein
MENPIVRFEHVVKKFGGKTAIADVSFDLPRGKIIGMIGPNGSGKSTMLKLMAGLLRPTKGKVWVAGKPAERRSSREVAYLSEQGSCYPFYTVSETLQFYRNIYADFDCHKAMEIIDFMQLDPQQKVGSLSKGNYTRLKMVVALSRRVPLVLLDEPLSGLDPMIRESVIQSLIVFVDLPKQTVIMTTHEVAEVEPVLDQIVAIRDGKIVRIDDVEHIRSIHGTGLVDWMKETFGQRSD